jgi:hypothetical protein
MNSTMAQYQNNSQFNIQNNILNNFQNNFQNNITMAPTMIVHAIVNSKSFISPGRLLCSALHEMDLKAEDRGTPKLTSSTPDHNPVEEPKRTKSRQNRQKRRNRQRRHRAEHQRPWRQIRNRKRRTRKSKMETRNIYKLDQCYEQRTAEGASYKYEIKSETSTP